MNIYEIDFRYSWIASIYEALEKGLSSIEEKGNEEEWFDGLWQLEHSESIFGIAFVSAQTYILGTVQDINKIRISSGKTSLDKLKYYADDTKPIIRGISRITLINAIANYFKHHEEWEVWPTNLTTKTLAEAGITNQTDFPCHEAATTLLGKNEYQKLENLLRIISEWRGSVITKYR